MGKTSFKDLTDKQFGHWHVLCYSGNRKWLCECSCGRTITEVHGYSLTSGKSTRCKLCNIINFADDLTNQQFGEWTAIKYMGNRKWHCKCSCGIERDVSSYDLTHGKSTSCGIPSRHNKLPDNFIDITGQKFNELTAIKYMGNGKWECECSCGNKIKTLGKYLRNLRVKSCGHLRYINIQNQRFGKLVAIRYLGSSRWLCQCDCGNKTIVLSANLLNKGTKSCGCIQHNKYNKEEIILKINEYIEQYGDKPYRYDLCSILDITAKTLRKYIEEYELNAYINKSYRSRYERELASLFSNIRTNVRDILDGYELDIYIPEKKLAIEFNGTYWHSEQQKDKHYHQQKTIACAKKGIQLIHIFEHEWKDTQMHRKLVNYLTLEKKAVYGRNTYITEISNKQADKFLIQYHFQNTARSSVRLACIDKSTNEILGVMTFGKPRFDRDYEYELIRFCWRDDVRVVGGAEKLFNYFISNYSVNSVVTYSDISKFTGNAYTRLGFKFVNVTEPNYKWVSIKDSSILNRYQTQKHKLIELGLGTIDQTEDEIMNSLNYLKIYDSGNLKLEWRK